MMNDDFERLFDRAPGGAGEASGQSLDYDVPHHHAIVDSGIRDMDGVHQNCRNDGTVPLLHVDTKRGRVRGCTTVMPDQALKLLGAPQTCIEQ